MTSRNSFADVLGSSPLARGLLPGPGRPPGGRRIIPACAGFTARRVAHAGARRDHPRLRGVYYCKEWACAAMEGSSPLARGLPLQAHVALPRRGIIPACAGFTCRARPGCPWNWDHPRLRGVYNSTRSITAMDLGSSPLARGLRILLGGGAGSRGIIPACAGFTIKIASAIRNDADHPRLRGVYAIRQIDAEARPGSSPLARGLRGHVRAHYGR